MSNVKQKTGMARLMQLTRIKKSLIVGSVIFAALASIASFIPYIAIFFIIKEILGTLPNLDTLNTAVLIGFGWLAFAGVVGNILLYFAALSCSHFAAFGTLYQLRVDFAAHLARIPLGFHVLTGSGKLRKTMNEDIEKIESFIAHQLPDIIAALIAPIVMSAILIFVDWRFGLAVLLGVVVALVVQMSMYGNKETKAKMAAYQKTVEEMNNAAVEYVRGIAVVKAFRQTVFSFRRLRNTIKAYTDVVIPLTFSWKNSFSAFVTLINNIYLFVIPVGILLGQSATDYYSFATVFIFYLIFVPSIAAVLMKVMYASSSTMKVQSGVAAMDEVLNEATLSQPAKTTTITNYDIAFADVTFSYSNSKNIEALAGISFSAKQGKVTAIVGPSGGGKSTIAHLIPRFFDVSGGKITLGGIDVREMQTEYLMDQVSFVFQDVFLFKQSVLENIKMGNALATEEDVVRAAKAAQCHDFIEKLPQGYNSIIGTRNVHLSGGERQRIAIARAIIKDAPVVVLDEATAFADPENEHLIYKAFEVLMQNKTVIIIAHRLSTIRNADNIVVIDSGKVIEQGTHDDLLSAKSKYQNMWEAYTKATSWKMERKKVVANA